MVHNAPSSRTGPNVQLKFALLNTGTPQYVIARDCGMSETRLSRIVRGRATPSAEERQALAAKLGRNVLELFP
jgi:transcriptional regulator with XRE-family HTH domain